MNILLINSSPRKEGNTQILLNVFSDTAKELGASVETVQIGNSNIKSCKACGVCREKKNKKCVINNDCFNEVFEKMTKADAIIFGSPTYFAGMTPELKCLIDRAGYVARGNDSLLKRKIAASVITQRRGGGTCVFEQINFMPLMSEMIVVGADYWNFANGGAIGEVENDGEGIMTVINLAKNVVWLLEKMAK